jgi:type VI secretion system protein ImpA
MKKEIDIDALLTPIQGENPGGADLRYSSEYDEIKDARRYDEVLEQGEWQAELRKADWEKVFNASLDALSRKTKDLQIAVWLMEALIFTDGFEGCATGLKVINGLLENFWESLYPPVEEDDLEYRVAPFEFMNDKLSSAVADVPITDNRRTPGYSWHKWQQSRQVGYEWEATNEEKRKRREESISEGKVTAEEFDSAVGLSPPGFYKSLSETLALCAEEFTRLDSLIDEKFGVEAPRLSDFGKMLEETISVVKKICKEKGLLAASESIVSPQEPPSDKRPEEAGATGGTTTRTIPAQPTAGNLSGSTPRSVLTDTTIWEDAFWEDALYAMKTGGLKKALEKLTEASLSAPSPRQDYRYKLYSAKLCLQAGRTDLARPVLEQLRGLIEELHLERWESPVWIAEVFYALYQCLMSGQPPDEDFSRAQELFQRICTIDMTKAVVIGT